MGKGEGGAASAVKITRLRKEQKGGRPGLIGRG